MEIIITIICAVDLILMAVVLIVLLKPKKNTYSEKLNELQNQIEILKQTNSSDMGRLLDMSSRQGDSAIKQIAMLGENLASSQDRQQNRNTEIISEIKTEMNELKKENRDSLNKINSVVTEKMQSTLDEKLNRAFESVVKNMSELGKTLNAAEERQQKNTTERLEALEKKFELIRHEINDTLTNVRNSNSESMEKLRRENRESLDRINDTVNEKLQKTLDDKITKSFESVSHRLAEVHDGLGQMKSIAEGVSDLKNVLSNVKTRGIMGEIQLDAILSEILTHDQYCEQISVSPDSSERVDFAVKLPGTKDGELIYLPVDSKFPGDTYSNLLDAYDSGDPEQLKEKRKALEIEIIRCAKSIHDKYIRPPYTTNFAIMFLPFEGLYAEVVNTSGMVERLQRDFSINIAGPSTMAAMLNSLQMGFKTLAIQRKSGEVWKILEAAKKEFSTFEDVLNKTRSRLKQADEELDKLIGTRTKAINRKLATVSALTSEEDASNILD